MIMGKSRLPSVKDQASSRAKRGMPPLSKTTSNPSTRNCIYLKATIIRPPHVTTPMKYHLGRKCFLLRQGPRHRLFQVPFLASRERRGPCVREGDGRGRAWPGGAATSSRTHQSGFEKVHYWWYCTCRQPLEVTPPCRARAREPGSCCSKAQLSWLHHVDGIGDLLHSTLLVFENTDYWLTAFFPLLARQGPLLRSRNHLRARARARASRSSIEPKAARLPGHGPQARLCGSVAVWLPDTRLSAQPFQRPADKPPEERLITKNRSAESAMVARGLHRNSSLLSHASSQDGHIAWFRLKTPRKMRTFQLVKSLRWYPDQRVPSSPMLDIK